HNTITCIVTRLLQWLFLDHTCGSHKTEVEEVINKKATQVAFELIALKKWPGFPGPFCIGDTYLFLK
ncbi:MAG: hypothetical protein ACREUR_08980, partial [Nitrosospira sp.]